MQFVSQATPQTSFDHYWQGRREYDDDLDCTAGHYVVCIQ